MKSYKCLINSTAGLRNEIITLDPNLQQTKQRLESGIIAELKIEKPTEVKETKTRKRRSKKAEL
jgi:hypothetical protein